MIASGQATSRQAAARLSLRRIASIFGEIWLMFSILCGVFLAVALYTFAPSDPGWSNAAEELAVVANSAGTIGAWCADVILNLFGYPGYLAPLVLVCVFWYMSRFRFTYLHYTDMGLRMTGMLFLLVGSCALAEVYFGHREVLPSGSGGGGVLGSYLADVLLEPVGVIGFSLFMLMLLAAGMSFLFSMSWLQVSVSLGTLLCACGEWLWQHVKARGLVFAAWMKSCYESFMTVGSASHAGAERAGQALDAADIAGTDAVPSLAGYGGTQRDAIAATGASHAAAGDAERMPGNDNDAPAVGAGLGLGSGAVGGGPAIFRDAPVGAGATPGMPFTQDGTVMASERRDSDPFVPSAEPEAMPAGGQGAAGSSSQGLAGPGLQQEVVPERDSWQRSGIPLPGCDIDVITDQDHDGDEGEPPSSGVAEFASAEDAGDLTLPPRLVAEDAQGTEPDGSGHEIAPAGRDPLQETLPEDMSAQGGEPGDIAAVGDMADDAAAGQFMEQGGPAVDITELTEDYGQLPGPAVPALEPDVAEDAACPDAEVGADAGLDAAAAKAPLLPEMPLPSVSLLSQHEAGGSGFDESTMRDMASLVEQRLGDFGVQCKVVGVTPGPVITCFELELAPGVKGSRVTNLSRDLARALSVVSVRVVEIIPGKSVLGLEVPNARRETVNLREILDNQAFTNSDYALPIALGKDIGGVPTVVGLDKMPHLLVAGTTGAGKSVALNAMILSILYRATARQVRLIMIDPKMLELSVYQDIPHLLAPVVTDMKEASNALKWCVLEMERRYQALAAAGVRNIAGYHRKQQASDEEVPDMPYIVVVIDELADMMMVTGKKVEEQIARLAQKARAAGIHLILATQRPSVDVITGLIKANIPSRISFQVSSRIDSRTILDQMGAENLLGHGDMLYLPVGAPVPSRLHGAFVDDGEVHRVADWLREAGGGINDYIDDVVRDDEEAAATDDKDEDGQEQDPLYEEAKAIVVESRRPTISYVQRRMRIGYNRAARLLEEMEARGVVSASEGGNREVLLPPTD